ncbi:F-box protein At3g07870-like [Rhododendron vialii]|uniref:F-box protein At3g07870-like n=1 Tax=Rhododendron vialii TaxID=182163 RepID=UPI0026604430|nr:F-box protein At3g07870-like [Rhododendron vialii]
MGNNKNLEWFRILGSCNGLLLVSHYTDLYMWTRQCTKVLSLPSDHWGEGVYNVVVELSASCGLCYDSSHDDYKAVMVCNDKPSYSVASFRRKNWVTTTCRFADEMNSGPVVNGKLHWVVIQHGNKGFSTDRIVYFDPITDEFLELSAPPGRYSFRGFNRVILGLGVLEGCLCMARIGCESGDEVEPGVIEFFVMRKYGVRESWSSIFVTSIFMGLASLHEFGNLVPLCYTKNGEVLIVVNKNKLFVCNPDKSSQREIPIPSDRYLIDVAPYTESLASPAAYGHEEEEEEDEEGEGEGEEEEDAENFVYFDWFCWSCYYSRDSLISPWRKVPVIIPVMWKGYGKTEGDLEKFKRRIDKARPKFLAEKEKTKVKRLAED